MSKILLISPDRVLRQVIVMFLFPNHDVDVAASLDRVKVNAYSLLIVDGSAGESPEAPETDLLRWVQGCQLPTLWLEENGEPCPVKRKNLLSVAKPLRRDSLRQALDSLLSPTAAEGSPETAPSKDLATSGKKAKRKKHDRKPNAAPIELVEVVEEAPSAAKGKETP